jgi:hypothetical protein
VPELTQETYAFVLIERDDGSAAGMMNDLELCPMAVRQRDRLDVDGDHATAKVSGNVLGAHAALLLS